jgi:O-antigen/teichoic acid export membrane protein
MLFRKFFFATIIGTMTSAVVGIVMAYKGFGVYALVGQYLTNSLIGTVALWIAVRWRPVWAFSFQSFKGLFVCLTCSHDLLQHFRH